MTPTYDPDNIFARILRGEAPCVKVYEDELALAFMDAMPRADGHTLVVPKVPARNLFDIDPQDLARFMPAVHKVALAVKAGMTAEGLTVMQFNETAGGQAGLPSAFSPPAALERRRAASPGRTVPEPGGAQPHADKIIAALTGG